MRGAATSGVRASGLALGVGLGAMLVSGTASADGWILEVGAGVPKLTSGELRGAGNLSLGYQTGAWSVVASGAIDYFDLDTEVALADTLRAEGEASAWWLSGAEADLLRLELRASGGVAWYDSTWVPRAAAPAGARFVDHTSLLLRGGAMVGGRLSLGAGDLIVVLRGGAGVQFEDYTEIRIQGSVDLLDRTELSVRPRGQLGLRWRAWREVLALRGLVDFSRFRITRDDLVVRVTATAMATGAAVAMDQTELSARLLIDVDALAFGGFVPAAFAGLEWVALDAPSGSTSTLVPVFGLELVRTTDFFP